MESNVLQKRWVQGGNVVVDDLRGTAFTGEAGAHTFQIYGVDSAQETVAITGTITGRFLTATNVTVPLTGSVSDGVASLTLTEDCYVVPGRFVLSVYATNGSTTQCIYCAVGNVFRTQSDIIEYPSASIPDIEQIIADAQAAVTEINADVAAAQAAVEAAQTAVDGIEAQKDTMIASIASVAGQGTDTTLTQSGVAADAKAAGDQISDLKSALDYAIAGEIEPSFVWEQGSWNATGKEANTLRIRPNDYIYATDAETITCSTLDGYEFAIFRWNQNGSYLGYWAWLTERTFETQPGYKYGICVRKQNNTSISVSENVNFTCVFETSRSIDAIKNELPIIYQRYGIFDKNATFLDANGVSRMEFFTSAIKDLYITGASENEQYAVGRITRNASGIVQINIWKSDYTNVLSAYVENTSDYTGVRILQLGSLNSSGMGGQIAIDFDVLELGTGYDGIPFASTIISQDYIFGTLREQNIVSTTVTRRWQGKKWYAIGDSFTEQNIYPYYLNQYCGFASYYNAGQSGRGMSAMVDRLSVEPLTNYDVVTVFAGTNDYGGGTVLGAITDSSSAATFYGYTRKVIEAIIAQKPTIRIAFMTPTIRGTFENQPVYPAANSAGVTLDQYVDAIKEVCAEYAIPVLDLFRLSQFNLLTLSVLTQDNLHPNYVGGQMLAKQIQGFIEAL